MMVAMTPPPMAAQAPAKPLARPQRMRLLVVEEELWLATLLREALCWDGHVVDHVRDGAAARGLAARGQHDAIVIGLLGEAGREACRGLRAQGIDAPIVILNPRATVDDVVAGLTAGADDYLAGLADRDELIARLRALIRRYRGAAPVSAAPARA